KLEAEFSELEKIFEKVIDTKLMVISAGK
ncbi:MAG: hypothetical protein JWO03_65, partial [Bacteroidetes bacterium]|nr:hypothetical protein [Bacteroidota bacterium]